MAAAAQGTSQGTYQRLVVKVGTSTLTQGADSLSQEAMGDLVRQMSALRRQGAQVLLVSSGAIATGREVLRFPDLPKEIPSKQMLAAVGQPFLMTRWRRLFAAHQVTIAQVLLTRDDLRSRRRYLNARNTLQALLAQGALPVINENDTVATEEIRVGDNDQLSALVANLVDADLLVLLTDQEGLFNADPRAHPEAELVPLVDSADIHPALWEAAGESGDLGVGGMHTKLTAADLARRSGAEVVIAHGEHPNVLTEIYAGRSVGTRFTPSSTALESRKRYILSGGDAGILTIDAGAARALARGASLLPAGVVGVEGDFERGATVTLCTREGSEIGRGIAAYHAHDCRRIAGRQSGEIEGLLGYFYGEEVVHHNDLVLM
jgi:glutamate 5-kinase